MLHDNTTRTFRTLGKNPTKISGVAGESCHVLCAKPNRWVSDVRLLEKLNVPYLRAPFACEGTAEVGRVGPTPRAHGCWAPRTAAAQRQALRASCPCAPAALRLPRTFPAGCPGGPGWPSFQIQLQRVPPPPPRHPPPPPPTGSLRALPAAGAPSQFKIS